MHQNEPVDGQGVGSTTARSRANPLRLTPGLADERRAESPHEGAAVAVLVGLLLLAIFVAAAFVGVLAQTLGVVVALVTACTALAILRTRVIAERIALTDERTASINHRIAQLQLKKAALELEAASPTRIDPPKAGPHVDDVVPSRPVQDGPSITRGTPRQS